MANADVTWALDEFRLQPSSRLKKYALARDYYEGRHPMGFATGQFKGTFGELFQAVSDNLCPAVIDSLVDRLELIGFASGSGPSTDQRSGEPPADAPADTLAQKAWDIWQRNRMDVRSAEVHRDALLAGDGFAIVWDDPEQPGQAYVWPQYPHQMAVEYDVDVPGRIARAAKLWRDADGFLRLNIFFPDRTEKWQSGRKISNQAASDKAPPGAILSDAWDRLAPSMRLDDTVVNEYDRVPVFHFPNKRLFTYGACGELVDIYPLQNALNKFTCDMLVAGEFAAFPQRWVTGLEDVGELDEEGRPKRPPFNYGVDKLLYLANSEGRFGNFDSAELPQFLEVLENFRAEIARVSGTPLHYLFITKGDFPSGEAMKSAEARFTKKLRDRQTWFGNVWEDLIAFALQIEGDDVGEEPLEAIWTNASPRSEKEIAETLLLKQKLGVPQVQIWKEMGYSDTEIASMQAEQPAPPAVPPVPVPDPNTVDVLPTDDGSTAV